MSNFYFILITIFFPILSVLSLLAHVQTERTRRHTTRALRRLRLDMNDISKRIDEQLTKDKRKSPELTPSPISSRTTPRNTHILSYAQESALLLHLNEILTTKLPRLPAPRISTIVNEFGNAIRGWRSSEGTWIEVMDEYLQNMLLRTLLADELGPTFGQTGGILGEFRVRFREVWGVGGGVEGGDGDHEVDEVGESVEGARLAQSWSGDTLVGREGEGRMRVSREREGDGR